jgi:tetratricopeptide (TPR) repeat protein
VTGLEETIGQLRGELLRHRADRHPREHAVLQFHLGTALIGAGRNGAAAVALRVSGDLFADLGEEIERAKALNMLGAALRETGDLNAAERAFTDAATAFEEYEQPLERGAALFNLGLVEQGQAGPGAGASRFAAALEIFEAGRAVGQASAAARELGAALLSSGQVEEAIEVLTRAGELASRAGDLASLGAAANVRGLAQLAAGDLEAAIVAFREAVGAHPRSIRPDAYAMAKANLALAHERAGEDGAARTAARQARDTAGAPAAVIEQAERVLGRYPGGLAASDLTRVLRRLDREAWGREIRDETNRWVERPWEELAREAAGWVREVAAWDGDRTELVEAWLDVLLELPPDAMEVLIAAVVRASREEATAGEPFRAAVSSAMGRFHVPQWMRLKDTFNRLADAAGQEPRWG